MQEDHHKALVALLAMSQRAVDEYKMALVDANRDTLKRALVQLRAGASLIDLVPAAGAPEVPRDQEAGNMDHFALRIDPFDEGALRAHLADHGVEVGEVARRYGAEGQGPSLYIQDPDGNTVELKGPPDRKSVV